MSDSRNAATICYIEVIYSNAEGVSGGPDGTRTRAVERSHRSESNESLKTARSTLPTDAPRQSGGRA